MDLDRRALQKIAEVLPSAELYRADFLADAHRRRHRPNALDAARRFDVILLNPPFSCRGNVSLEARIDNCAFRTSTAMSFVVRALHWLACTGELLAIVPASCLTSQKDRVIRGHLETNWRMDIVEQARSRDFSGCAVTVAIIRITRRSGPMLGETQKPAELISPVRVVRIFRGNLSVARAADLSGRVPFVHTTHLRNYTLNSEQKVSGNHRSVTGSAVLIPRVGRPRQDKIALKTTKSRIVISDCVIAIQPPEEADAKAIHELIVKFWPKMLERYSGTCAPYITVEAVEDLLRQFGYGLADAPAENGPTRPDADASMSPNVPVGSKRGQLRGSTTKPAGQCAA
jgi:hypothetical protein